MVIDTRTLRCCFFTEAHPAFAITAVLGIKATVQLFAIASVSAFFLMINNATRIAVTAITANRRRDSRRFSRRGGRRRRRSRRGSRSGRGRKRTAIYTIPVP
jgi:hypothetical protein